MSTHVHEWLVALKQGNEEAAQELWNQFFPRLCRCVSRESKALRWVDDEDIALDAVDDFCRQLKLEQFGEIKTREELWRLLATIAVNKTRDFHRHQNAQCRGGNVRVMSFNEVRDSLQCQPKSSEPFNFRRVFAELLASIGDERLVRVLKLKMDGASTHDIAQVLGCGIRQAQSLVQQVDRRVSQFNGRQASSVANPQPAKKVVRRRT